MLSKYPTSSNLKFRQQDHRLEGCEDSTDALCIGLHILSSTWQPLTLSNTHNNTKKEQARCLLLRVFSVARGGEL